jgi:hypothetical protein
MTPQEMQKRNGKALQLRVIQVDTGSFYVESGDGKVAYKCLVTDEKELCTCLDYQKNAPTDPNFRCKHLMAVLNCAPEGAEKKAFLKKRQPKLDERFIKNIEGKDFVLYAGLLDLANQKGMVSLEVEILQFPTKENGNMAICRAMAESKLGETFSDIGDADPTNCNYKVAKHLLRIASTRGKARCLRDFTNIGMTCLEELGDLNEVLDDNSKVVSIGTRGSTQNKNETSESNGEPKTKPETSAAPDQGKGNQAQRAKAPEAQKAQNPQNGNGTSSEPKTVAKMSEAQKRAIYNLSRRRGISVEELKKLAMEGYNVALEELSSPDASKFIRQLQQSA